MDFFDESPDYVDLQLQRKWITNWLQRNKDKAKRPDDIDDILDEIIEMLAGADARWRSARPSSKKTTRKRYKSLYDSYRDQVAKFDRQQGDDEFKVPKEVTFAVTRQEQKDPRMRSPEAPKEEMKTDQANTSTRRRRPEPRTPTQTP